jgi:hypothetical protein
MRKPKRQARAMVPPPRADRPQLDLVGPGPA